MGERKREGEGGKVSGSETERSRVAELVGYAFILLSETQMLG